MSKKLIAGLGVVAGLAVAMAPVATFAADAGWNSDQHTDTLNVTVLPTCAFGAVAATPIDGITHNTGADEPDATNATNAATWTDGEDDHLGMTPDKATGGTAHVTTDSADYSIYAGTADSNMGTTTLTVVCNQNNGYKIKVTAANLRIGETSDYINVVASPSATVTGYNITTGTVSGVTTANVTSTNETEAVAKGSASAATGDAYTFTYGIGVAPGTTAGTYTGDVVYTLVQQLGA